MVARKNVYSIVVALVVILGFQALLYLGLAYSILSFREWGIGLLAWFAIPLLWTVVRKLAPKNDLASSGEPAIALSERARKRSLRGIWITKAWICLLAVALPFGIANGVAHRAWLPTLIGVGMNLLLMHVAIQRIRWRRERLNLTPQ
jgi:hypothetical protein